MQFSYNGKTVPQLFGEISGATIYNACFGGMHICHYGDWDAEPTQDNAYTPFDL